ncbi:hypothetical protein TBLA_0E02690 [Henningerozyma blattae CBS 6284]|uniref:Uncharacterized protein n=1 Tax=Henningerozyma blattae (strain ATCC 34711 / CBS 6284 / DSM 70876 / NBRC 10599 / NRRL Y-10934 / UCD 77-7) TaxID=1071380 RepID=I2H4M3_HENB6|nr:hypothetical protein TBLA_0E02690 [Tetrapisispora blattae CBS 6284]CCH61325.1 hypothetical protein TBLA_0E02690 [Tetrapisispora blattae CBS 6284]
MPGKNHKHGSDDSNAKGLQTEINPLLLSDNLNLVKQQFKNSNQNPYLQDSSSKFVDYKLQRRFDRGLKFFKKGEKLNEIAKKRKIIHDSIEKNKLELQLQNELERKRLNDLRTKIENAELPDQTKNEEKYLKSIETIPKVEWWDEPYLNETSNSDTLTLVDKYRNDYSNLNEDDDSDEDDEDGLHPSLRFIQHPVPIAAKANSTSESSVVIPKLYLTKLETKKLRRNNRKLIREEKESRIKSGLDPKPDPKVKLSNMMAVFENNQNITDPTAWENTVKTQINDRKQKHLQENEKRHLEAVERRKANALQNSMDISSYYCKVFYFKNLQNPKIRYKINTNSKQLALKGTCLRIGQDGPGVIISIGKEKSCNKFEKLLTNRIQWNEPFKDRDNDNKIITPTDNICIKTWEGILEESKFNGWFMTVCDSREHLISILSRSNAESFLDTPGMEL